MHDDEFKPEVLPNLARGHHMVQQKKGAQREGAGLQIYLNQMNIVDLMNQMSQ